MTSQIVTPHPVHRPSGTDQRNGKIQVIFGPMFSGKTTELVRRIRRYQIAKYRCVLVKYAKDCRYDEDGVATHDLQILPAVSAVKLSDITQTVGDYEVIGIDEGQFFPDVVSFCDEMAEQGRIVIVAALDGTFQRKGFGDILNLVPLAESVIKLSAVCMGCFREAAYTKRKGRETQVEVIGGTDKYEASCRECFISPTKKPTTDKENCDRNLENLKISDKLNDKNAANPPLTKHTTRAKRPILGEREVCHVSPPKVVR